MLSLLADYGLTVDDWGGEVVLAAMSALCSGELPRPSGAYWPELERWVNRAA
jgi:hypothetical protein